MIFYINDLKFMTEIEEFKKIILQESPDLSDDQISLLLGSMEEMADMFFSQWIQSLPEDV